VGAFCMDVHAESAKAAHCVYCGAERLLDKVDE
jgi:hypothetical protein